jgi:thiamine biosynthesis lipoprotein
MSQPRFLISSLQSTPVARLAVTLALTWGLLAGLPQTTEGAAPLFTTEPLLDELQGFVKEEAHMGVRFRISLYCASPNLAEQAFAAGFAEIARLEQVFSDYRDDSETRRLDHGPLDTPLSLSADMHHLLLRSVDLNHRTLGYFDVTLGALTKPWRAARKANRPPTDEELAIAQTRVGMELLEFTETPALIKRAPGCELDFGGIAKGYAADQVLRLLAEKFGVTRVLIDASGDLVAGDPPPGQQGWQVGLARPADEPGKLRRILLANQALAGSGDASQFLLADQTRWSHLLDPLRREPIVGRNLTLVFAPDGTTADALASALSVCPAEKFQLIVAAFPQVDAKRYRQLADDRDREVLESPQWGARTLALELPTTSDSGQR